MSTEVQREGEIARLREALALVYPTPHYGEREGLANCPRNGYSAPLTDAEMQSYGPGAYYHPERECDCGADETNARIASLIGTAQEPSGLLSSTERRSPPPDGG